MFFRRVDAIYIFLKLLIFTTSNLIFLIQTFISLIFVPKGHIKRQVVREYQEPTQSIDLKTLLGLLVNWKSLLVMSLYTIIFVYTRDPGVRKSWNQPKGPLSVGKVFVKDFLKIPYEWKVKSMRTQNNYLFIPIYLYIFSLAVTKWACQESLSCKHYFFKSDLRVRLHCFYFPLPLTSHISVTTSTYSTFFPIYFFYHLLHHNSLQQCHVKVNFVTNCRTGWLDFIFFSLLHDALQSHLSEITYAIFLQSFPWGHPAFAV